MCIYLAARGLSCGTQGLPSLLWHTGSLVAACKFLVVTCGGSQNVAKFHLQQNPVVHLSKLALPYTKPTESVSSENEGGEETTKGLENHL